jgi:hypothetical protein
MRNQSSRNQPVFGYWLAVEDGAAAALIQSTVGLLVMFATARGVPPKFESMYLVGLKIFEFTLHALLLAHVCHRREYRCHECTTRRVCKFKIALVENVLERHAPRLMGDNFAMDICGTLCYRRCQHSIPSDEYYQSCFSSLAVPSEYAAQCRIPQGLRIRFSKLKIANLDITHQCALANRYCNLDRWCELTSISPFALVLRDRELIDRSFENFCQTNNFDR